jgi:hypothetical protein
MTPVGHEISLPALWRVFSFSSSPKCFISVACSAADLGCVSAIPQSDTHKYVVLLPFTASRDVHISHCAAFFSCLNQLSPRVHIPVSS